MQDYLLLCLHTLISCWPLFAEWLENILLSQVKSRPTTVMFEKCMLDQFFKPLAAFSYLHTIEFLCSYAERLAGTNAEWGGKLRKCTLFRDRPNIGFGYDFSLVSVMAVTHILVLAWFRLRP